MSAELEVILNDLVMKAEKENAAFIRELTNSELVAKAAEHIRRLNESAFNESLMTLQKVRQTMMEQHHQPQSLPTFPPAWN